jgi:hypothetical protein
MAKTLSILTAYSKIISRVKHTEHEAIPSAQSQGAMFYVHTPCVLVTGYLCLINFIGKQKPLNIY